MRASPRVVLVAGGSLIGLAAYSFPYDADAGCYPKKRIELESQRAVETELGVLPLKQIVALVDDRSATRTGRRGTRRRARRARRTKPIEIRDQDIVSGVVTRPTVAHTRCDADGGEGCGLTFSLPKGTSVDLRSGVSLRPPQSLEILDYEFAAKEAVRMDRFLGALRIEGVLAREVTVQGFPLQATHTELEITAGPNEDPTVELREGTLAADTPVGFDCETGVGLTRDATSRCPALLTVPAGSEVSVFENSHHYETPTPVIVHGIKLGAGELEVSRNGDTLEVSGALSRAQTLGGIALEPGPVGFAITEGEGAPSVRLVRGTVAQPLAIGADCPGHLSVVRPAELATDCEPLITVPMGSRVRFEGEHAAAVRPRVSVDLYGYRLEHGFRISKSPAGLWVRSEYETKEYERDVVFRLIQTAPGRETEVELVYDNKEPAPRH